MTHGDSVLDAAGTLDCAGHLRRFREANRAYEVALDAEKENHFARRYGALMLVLGTTPQTRDQVCDVMGIALEELAKDLTHDGPLPDAVKACLGNCLRAMQAMKQEPPKAIARASNAPTGFDSDAPPLSFIQMEAEIAKLDSFVGLLTYLGKHNSGKVEGEVFLSLKNSAESIGYALSSAVRKLMPAIEPKRDPDSRDLW
jgi:hypothetical protein